MTIDIYVESWTVIDAYGTVLVAVAPLGLVRGIPPHFQPLVIATFSPVCRNDGIISGRFWTTVVDHLLDF